MLKRSLFAVAIFDPATGTTTISPSPSPAPGDEDVYDEDVSLSTPHTAPRSSSQSPSARGWEAR